MKRVRVLFILGLLLACSCSHEVPTSPPIPVTFVELQNMWGATRIGELDMSTGAFELKDGHTFAAPNGFLQLYLHEYRFVFDTYGGNIYLCNGFEYMDFALYFQDYILYHDRDSIGYELRQTDFVCEVQTDVLFSSFVVQGNSLFGLYFEYENSFDIMPCYIVEFDLSGEFISKTEVAFPEGYGLSAPMFERDVSFGVSDGFYIRSDRAICQTDFSGSVKSVLSWAEVGNLAGSAGRVTRIGWSDDRLLACVYDSLREAQFVLVFQEDALVECVEPKIDYPVLFPTY